MIHEKGNEKERECGCHSVASIISYFDGSIRINMCIEKGFFFLSKILCLPSKNPTQH
jgi:hypothetical protein